MAESKTGKYIIKEMKPNLKPAAYSFDPVKTAGMWKRVLFMDGDYPPGAFYLTCSWFLKKTAPEGMKAHAHKFDEALAFFGTDPDDPYNLNGEVELWLDGEKHLLTRSCIVFVPKGMKHCPLIINRVDKPIFHFTTGPSNVYR